MFRRYIFALLATPLVIAPFAQNAASAQGAAYYQRNQSVGHPNANVRSALTRFTRGRLSNVFGDAAGVRIRSQRTLNENSFIVQDRNLEGYPRPAD